MATRLAITGGHGLLGSAFAAGAARVEHAGVPLLDAGSFVILQRHGLDTFTPAHLVDHRRHVDALVDAGCDRVFALSSVGSLRLDWRVGAVVVPDDFYAPQVSPSRFDDAGGHTVPGFDLAWRARVVSAWRDATATPLIDGGVYAQTTGPRFETPAEVRALARDADLVGMTVASECILAGEAGLAYAAVCVVDNVANGLLPERLTIEEFRAGVARNQARLLADLEAVLPVIA